MRKLAQNMARFSWAMTLFGARQMGAALNPRGQGAGDAFGAVTDKVVEQFGQNLRQTFDVGEKVQTEIINAMFGVLSPGGGTQPSPAPGGCGCSSGGDHAPEDTSGIGVQPPIFEAQSPAGETVLITYTHGTGTFSEDKKFIGLYNQIYNLDGVENGLHEGVWEALFDNPAALLARPAPPTGPMNQPVGPVDSYPVSANTIAKWTHADGSSISSVGPAASHLIPLSNGSFLFLVITAQIITEGTGRFAGANGITQSLGATYVPAGTNLFAPDGPTSFPALTLDTFKFVTLSQPPDLEATAKAFGSGGSPSGAGGQGSPAAGGQGAAASSGQGTPAASGQVAEPIWPTPQACAPGEPSCEVTPNPNESKFVEVLGSRMHYVEQGSGDTLLFLHGNPVWSYIWKEVLPNVSPNVRCIAPDLIGMGLSDKPDIKYTFFDHVDYIEGFIQALNLKNITLVLHDWGCIIGFYVAMRQQANIRGMAFMEAMLAPYPSFNAFPPEIAATFEGFRKPKEGYQQIVVENAFVEVLLPASTIVPLTDNQMNCFREPFVAPASRKVILEFANQLPIGGKPADVTKATAEYSRWLRKTNLPKLFLWANPGLITTKKDVEWAKKNYKNLTTSFLGDGLHFLQLSHPKEIGEEVSRWHAQL